MERSATVGHARGIGIAKRIAAHIRQPAAAKLNIEQLGRSSGIHLTYRNLTGKSRLRSLFCCSAVTTRKTTMNSLVKNLAVASAVSLMAIGSAGAASAQSTDDNARAKV